MVYYKTNKNYISEIYHPTTWRWTRGWKVLAYRSPNNKTLGTIQRYKFFPIWKVQYFDAQTSKYTFFIVKAMKWLWEEHKSYKKWQPKYYIDDNGVVQDMDKSKLIQ